MGRYAYDAKTKITWCTSIADISAPTVTELNNGIELTRYVSKDGLQPNPAQNMVDSASIADVFNAQVVGSWGMGMTLNMFRDDADDAAWEAVTYNTEGFLVVRRGVLQSVPWDDGQAVEVYPAQMHEPVPQGSAQDTNVRFTAALAIREEPNLKAVVDGGGS